MSPKTLTKKRTEKEEGSTSIWSISRFAKKGNSRSIVRSKKKRMEGGGKGRNLFLSPKEKRETTKHGGGKKSLLSFPSEEIVLQKFAHRERES